MFSAINAWYVVAETSYQQFAEVVSKGRCTHQQDDLLDLAALPLPSGKQPVPNNKKSPSA